MPTFAVEYRTPAGRLKTIRVEAASEDAAIDAAVNETGCDFGDIQTTERRDSAADKPTDFERHVALIREARPNLTNGKARFAAWQEGPDGLARRIEADPAPTLESIVSEADAMRDRYQIFDSLDRACGPEASREADLIPTLETLQAEAKEKYDRTTYAIAKWTGDGWTFEH